MTCTVSNTSLCTSGWEPMWATAPGSLPPRASEMVSRGCCQGIPFLTLSPQWCLSVVAGFHSDQHWQSSRRPEKNSPASSMKKDRKSPEQVDRTIPKDTVMTDTGGQCSPEHSNQVFWNKDSLNFWSDWLVYTNWLILIAKARENQNFLLELNYGKLDWCLGIITLKIAITLLFLFIVP